MVEKEKTFEDLRNKYYNSGMTNHKQTIENKEQELDRISSEFYNILDEIKEYLEKLKEKALYHDINEIYELYVDLLIDAMK